MASNTDAQLSDQATHLNGSLSELLLSGYNLTDDPSKLGHTLPGLFERAAECYPDSTAVICGNEQLTYRELISRSESLVRAFQSHGIGRGQIVGVALDRSFDLVVAFLSVLKAGAAYIPIDPALPAERVKHMLDDDDLRAVVTQTEEQARDYSYSPAVACFTVDELRRLTASLPEQEDDNTRTTPTQPVSPEDLAFILYTSGSTGKPKGVQLHHDAVCSHILGMHELPGCSPQDRVLAKSTVSFDMGIYEIYTALTCGACIVLAETKETKDARGLINLIERHGVSISIATPALWQMLLDAGWVGSPSLYRILSAGEPLTARLAARLLECAVEVWNLYGPTETTMAATALRVLPGAEVTVGTALTNTRLYVLDDDLKPVSIGIAGELYISGTGVSHGYRNNPRRSKAAFMLDPFRDGGHRMYRTGDLARFVDAKELSILGRVDSQIKIRGQLIEPGDVEAAIADHASIANAVVVERDGLLVAYCVPKQRPDSEENAEMSVESILRPWLGERLPPYMMPSIFVEIDKLPVTINGKLDTRVLPDPVLSIQTQGAPVGELEEVIRSIWVAVLGHSNVGTGNSFFDIGGDSARVIQLQAAIEKETGHSVPTAKLYEHYTIRMLAEYLSRNQDVPLGPDTDTLHPKASREDIAVVSMACRLPGDINSPEEFWQVLFKGKDVVGEVPRDRWDAHAIYDPDPHAQGKSYSTGGGFVHNAMLFDAAFFGISPQEARAMDPAQSMILETCWEGLERGGYATKKLRGSLTGVYIGTGNSLVDDGHLRSFGMESLGGHVGLGSAPSALSGRVSFAFGLEGPSLTVDAGCAASLVATHLACTALRQGECDMAIAGGVTFLPSSGLHVEFSRLGIASPDGRSRPFSADATGMGLGEGASAVILKRLSDAQSDGDNIHAVIRGSSVTHGGRGPSMTAPSAKGQKRMIRHALAVAGLKPHDIDYVEAHGTGTLQGDPIEGTAIAEVYGSTRSAVSGPIKVGSSKSNIAHTQAAAGVAGLIKIALAMRHGVLPQTLHSGNPTPAIDWEGANMQLLQAQSPWALRADGTPVRRAGVNSFGIAGTSAHVVVEDLPKPEQIDRRQVASAKSMPFLLSARTHAALVQQASNLKLHLGKIATASDGCTRISDVAYSLATTRTHFTQRAVLVARDERELKAKLSSFAKSNAMDSGSTLRSSGIAMLFSGQGSQWIQMGRNLASQYKVFDSAIREVASHFTLALENPLLDVMWADADSELAPQLQRTDYAQPAIFTLQVALSRLWASWNVHPKVVVGHSIGELAAAHIAGVMNLTDACRMVSARGKLMQALPETGAMMAIKADVRTVNAAMTESSVADKLSIAAINSPAQVVVSGDKEALEKLEKRFESRGCQTKHLEASRAFHSHHLDQAFLGELRKAVESVSFNSQNIPIVSTLTGQLAEPGEMSCADYWLKQARGAVLFADSMHVLWSQGIDSFVEIGPRPVLCGMGAKCLADEVAEPSKNLAWLPSADGKNEESYVIQRSLSELHRRHVEVDWEAYFQDLDGCRRVELPTYAFQRQRHWLAGQSESTRPQSSEASSSSLLSSPTRPQSTETPSSSISSLENSKFGSDVQADWQTIDGAAGRSCHAWAVLCPAGEVSWTVQLRQALENAGKNSLYATQLGDVEQTDTAAAICVWDAAAGAENDASVAALARQQLLLAAEIGFAPTLAWVTRGAFANDGDGATADTMGESSLWTMMRRARDAHPQLQLRIVDLPAEIDKTVAATTIVSVLTMRSESECVVRDGRVLVPWMKLRQMARTDSALSLQTPPRQQTAQQTAQQTVQRGDEGIPSSTKSAPISEGNFMQRLETASEEERVVMLQQLVREATAQSIGLESSEHIDMYSPFEDVGLDSLASIQLRKMLLSTTGVMLVPHFNMTYPSLMAVCEVIKRELQSA